MSTTKQAPAAARRPLTGVDLATVQLIPMELLHRSPYQVREEGDVSELAADIQAHGLINPITVRPRAAHDGFEVVAGHRRWAAMRSVEPAAEVPCIVLDVDDRTAEELLVAENFVRADLSIMEQAETVAMLTEHGRTAEECGRVCRRSVRWAHRMRAIGGIGEPWRGFFHAMRLPYDDVLSVARVPDDLREQAWGSLLGYLADRLSYTVRRGNEEDADARGTFLRELEAAAGDRARFLDFLVRAAPPSELPSPTDAAELVDDWFNDDAAGLLAFCGAARLLDAKKCPFDCARECAGCVRRSDAQPELFDEGEERQTPRCYDAACWAKRVAKHVRATIEAARERGVTAAAKQSSSYDWRDRDTLEKALEEAGGDASRVTPVVKIFGDADDARPTGRVLWRVAAEDAEDGPAEKPAPTKRKPWEEWCPENPRWLPTLFGATRDRAWFAAGLAAGLAYHDDADDRDEWFQRALQGVSAEDFAELVVRCEFVRELGERRADFLAADVASYSGVESVRAAARVYREARKHLPAKDDRDDEDAGDE